MKPNYTGMREQMQLALDHAEDRTPGWQDMALSFVERYQGKDVFLAEDVRYWAESCGLPRPPSQRAWGAVMCTARRRGLIERAGFGQTRSLGAHPTVATLWRKKV